MSLHKYELDFSKLSNEDRINLTNHIERYCFDDVDYDSNSHLANFSIDEEIDISFLNIPASCHPTRVL